MIQEFIVTRQGEFAALLTAFFWTITALAFESASKKVGSLSVNLIRLVIAFFLLGIFSWIVRGMFFPTDAAPHNWIWLSLSGLVGFVLGDLFLFRAYVVVGARISMLIMALAPPIAAIIGWFVMGEKLTLQQLAAMVVTFAGIALVILKREIDEPELLDGVIAPKGNRKKVKFSYPISGILLAFGGAVGQGGGLVLSKFGMADYDVFAAVQIRVLTGVVGFAGLFLVLNRWKALGKALKNGKAMARLSVGAFFGPFLGVSFSLWAVKYTTTGVASAIMSIVPVLIIPPSIWILKEKFNPKEFIGAFIAIAGVVLFFI
ncbi:MAG TPA: DMT family transporter [Tenuifilaceae bacterium]|nr:DMT family transporter [Tenuifilaceae bacterium]HPE18605.1 DMT family transporter [Tenuifilaceae bacterium]HPJ46024.1 DMT family transporter [Tenuifilaceae bacterium]HPQ34727.1 DMT family transporter [Tenuifilaceae bacterium]HRX67356.1 DMT family transporter [Tenuifilaceae bacterium]